MDCSIGTISSALIARLSRERVRDITLQFPRLARAFWRTTLVEQAIAREWLINVGQRTAFSRAAHLLCEMFLRLRAVGLAQDNICEFPLNPDRNRRYPCLVHRSRQPDTDGTATFRSDYVARQASHHSSSTRARSGGRFTSGYLHLEASLDEDVTSRYVSHGCKAKKRDARVARRRRSRRDHSRARLVAYAARADSELAGLPAHGAWHLPSFKRASRGLLGPTSSSRFTTTCVRISSGATIPHALGMPRKHRVRRYLGDSRPHFSPPRFPRGVPTGLRSQPIPTQTRRSG